MFVYGLEIEAWFFEKDQFAGQKIRVVKGRVTEASFQQEYHRVYTGMFNAGSRPGAGVTFIIANLNAAKTLKGYIGTRHMNAEGYFNLQELQVSSWRNLDFPVSDQYEPEIPA
jgi:hypothetical protein